MRGQGIRIVADGAVQDAAGATRRALPLGISDVGPPHDLVVLAGGEAGLPVALGVERRCGEAPGRDDNDLAERAKNEHGHHFCNTVAKAKALVRAATQRRSWPK